MTLGEIESLVARDVMEAQSSRTGVVPTALAAAALVLDHPLLQLLSLAPTFESGSIRATGIAPPL
jgi:hypothetical protein